MRLIVEINRETYPLECAPDASFSLLLAGLQNNLMGSSFGAIVGCKTSEWRLTKEDLDLYTLQTIGAEDGDVISIEKSNHQEPPFELPPLGDKMNNLIRSIVVGSTPQEKVVESFKAAKMRETYTELKTNKNMAAHFSFVAPQVLRYLLAHPDDFGGFLLVYNKWEQQQGSKRKMLDERLEQTMMHTPELMTPPSTLYIKGQINGHEVAAMIDTGAQTTVMQESVARKLGLMDVIDDRGHVSAVSGVGGKTRPLGKVFNIDFHLSAGVVSVCAIILPNDGTMGNHFILGLDVMLCHGCVIDLPNRRLTFSGHHEPILSVEECSQIDRAKHGAM